MGETLQQVEQVNEPHPSRVSSGRTYSSIHMDAVRGIAALVVFFAHARGFFFTLDTAPRLGSLTAGMTRAASTTLNDATTYGHQAVVVFFVLSGFLVGGSVLRDIAKNRWSWKRYTTNRLTRLWVVLIPALLLGFVLDHIGIAHFAGRGFVYACYRDLPARVTGTVLINNICFLQGILATSLGTNVALWSLSYEFWYYVLFPLATLALVRYYSAPKRALCMILFAAAAIFVGPNICLYFLIWLIGVLATKVPCAIPRSFLNATTWMALGQFVTVNIILRKATLPMRLSDALLSVSFFPLLFCIQHYRGSAPAGLYAAASQFTSKISYTLYLTHCPAFALLFAILGQPAHGWPRDARHGLLFLLCVSAVFTYSTVVYFLFEARTDMVRGWIAHLLGLRQLHRLGATESR